MRSSGFQGSIQIRKTRCQPRPVEAGAGIGLAAWRDVLMPSDLRHWIHRAKCLDEPPQRGILCFGVGCDIASLQFDSH